jgi:apolipoprotein D and lipocalin family protein
MKILSSAAAGLFALLTGCTGIPDGLEPVQNFDENRYLGKWYEIARLDHGFERGLDNVSAMYTVRDDGGIDVLNRGYNAEDGTWELAEGRAYFQGERTTGSLKVTFFWPFYGGYHVLALDRKDYGYAMVCGPDRSYLWILARERKLDPAVQAGLVAEAARLGFDTDALIFVAQDRPDA